MKFQHYVLFMSHHALVRLVFGWLASWQVGSRAMWNFSGRRLGRFRETVLLKAAETNFDVDAIFTPVPQGWSFIGLKTLEALKFVLKNFEFDYLFRTNTSSYVDARLLVQQLANLPKFGVYAGYVGTVFGQKKFASGAGILLSRDVVERVCDNEKSWNHSLTDDVALAELVFGLVEPRIDLTPLDRLTLSSLESAASVDPEEIWSNFHIRCKGESPQETLAIMHFVESIKSGSMDLRDTVEDFS